MEKKYILLFSIIVLFGIAYNRSINSRRINVQWILDTELLNVYNSDGELMVAIDNPVNLLGGALIDEFIVVGITRFPESLPRINEMDVLYKLVFEKNNYPLKPIYVLVPNNKVAEEKLNNLSIRYFSNKYNQNMVLYQDGRFFTLGRDFFDNIINILRDEGVSSL